MGFIISLPDTVNIENCSSTNPKGVLHGILFLCVRASVTEPAGVDGPCGVSQDEVDASVTVCIVKDINLLFNL